MKRPLLLLSLLLSLLLAACAGGGAAPTATPPASSNPTAAPTAASGGNLTKVQMALGFVPSVASAPFYLAQDKGYYAAEGLDVELNYGATQNLLSQVADGTITFASVSGDSLIPQRLQGVNVTYIMAFYQKNPIGALAIQGNSSPLKSPADLKGKNIGVSAPNGSTYYGLLALLKAANLSLDDVKVTAIGTTEVESLTQKRIDAAMTFLPNESAQMKSMKIPVETLAVSDYFKIVPPGFAVGDKYMKDHPDIVQKFVNATLHGLKDMIANPDEAFASSLERMPELSPDNQPLQRDALSATVEYYKPQGGRSPGQFDASTWAATQEFLKSINVIQTTADPTTFYTTRFADAAK